MGYIKLWVEKKLSIWDESKDGLRTKRGEKKGKERTVVRRKRKREKKAKIFIKEKKRKRKRKKKRRKEEGRMSGIRTRRKDKKKVYRVSF